MRWFTLRQLVGTSVLVDTLALSFVFSGRRRCAHSFLGARTFSQLNALVFGNTCVPVRDAMACSARADVARLRLMQLTRRVVIQPPHPPSWAMRSRD